MKNIWEVSMEDPKDPFGEGLGIVLLVHAKTRKGAKTKANNHIKRQVSYSYYRAYRVKRMPTAVI